MAAIIHKHLPQFALSKESPLPHQISKIAIGTICKIALAALSCIEALFFTLLALPFICSKKCTDMTTRAKAAAHAASSALKSLFSPYAISQPKRPPQLAISFKALIATTALCALAYFLLPQAAPCSTALSKLYSAPSLLPPFCPLAKAVPITKELIFGLLHPPSIFFGGFVPPIEIVKPQYFGQDPSLFPLKLAIGLPPLLALSLVPIRCSPSTRHLEKRLNRLEKNLNKASARVTALSKQLNDHDKAFTNNAQDLLEQLAKLKDRVV